MNRIDLTGRVAVVTGGAQGIGRAVAKRLVASGARVSLWDQDRDVVFTAAEQFDKEVHVAVVDQTDYEAVQKPS